MSTQTGPTPKGWATREETPIHHEWLTREEHEGLHVTVLRPILAKDELDYSKVAQVAQVSRSIPRYPGLGMIVDLSAIVYLDSSGLSWMIKLQKDVRAHQGTVVFVTNEVIDNILSLTKANSILFAVGTFEAAIDLLKKINSA